MGRPSNEQRCSQGFCLASEGLENQHVYMVEHQEINDLFFQFGRYYQNFPRRPTAGVPEINDLFFYKARSKFVNSFPTPVNSHAQPLMMAGVAAALARVSVHVAQCRFTVLLRIASGTRDKSLVERRDRTFMILFTRPPEGRRSAPSHRGAKEAWRIKAYLRSRALVSILSVRPTTYKRLSDARARLWTRPDPVGATLRGERHAFPAGDEIARRGL